MYSFAKSTVHFEKFRMAQLLGLHHYEGEVAEDLVGYPKR